jgi:hypothetical protein
MLNNKLVSKEFYWFPMVAYVTGAGKEGEES